MEMYISATLVGSKGHPITDAARGTWLASKQPTLTPFSLQTQA